MTTARTARAAATAPLVAPRLGATLQRNARKVAPILKAMSNPSRLVILCQLAEGERSVGELEDAVGLSQSGISQHLGVLRRERVVVTRRERQTVFYSLASRDIVALITTLHDVFCKPPAGPRRPRRAAAARKA
jgi:DNA-binding transcriptional ArsR family regulator